MSNKIKQIYTCQKCGAQFPKWSGRCLECGSWDSLQQETKTDQEIKRIEQKIEPAAIQNLAQLTLDFQDRIKTNIGEIDRVFGGGIMPGSMILLSGEPGIGKSTLLAQLGNSIKEQFIYVSGEESAQQVKSRFERLQCNINNVLFINEIAVEKIISTLEKYRPKLVIIDSIQTVYSLLSPSEAGSIHQIRASTVQFLELAKKYHIAVIIVGHITKDGNIAGPKSLEHIVDVVLYLETEKSHNYHILKATKNRFGSVNEVGILEMAKNGFSEIKNPSSIFLETSEKNITGSVISVIMEGSRPFLVEIQALVTKTAFGYPQRKASGFDINRLQVLAAVLTKRAKINLSNQDIILNIVGGHKINDPALDLAVSLAIISSLLNQVIDRSVVAIGEVGLGGEARSVGRINDRVKEIEKLGYQTVFLPNTKIKKPAKIKIIKISNLNELIAYIKNS